MSTSDASRRSRYEIAVHRSSRRVPVAVARLREVMHIVLKDEQVRAAELSVAIVSDAEIHAINREHLDHDFSTDVISFLYSGDRTPNENRGPGPARRGAGLEIEGELVLSDETALREAPRHGWPPASELELYLVHGLLHLCGYDDLSPAERRVMRRRERELMSRIAHS